MDDTNKIMDDTNKTLAEDPALEGLLDTMLNQARRRIETRMRTMRRPSAGVGIARSALGPLLVAESARGLLMVHYLEHDDPMEALGPLRLRYDPVEDRGVAERVGKEVRRYLGGDRAALGRPVDLGLATGEFQRAALARLHELPVGALLTYNALARAIGSPSSQRAIGNAMGANPIPIYVPCHRVVRSDGSIGNYGGGVERKLKLLRAEGFALGAATRSDAHIPASAVWGHRRSHIFCRPACPAFKRSDPSNSVIFADPRTAQRNGMRPCRVCHPM